MTRLSIVGHKHGCRLAPFQANLVLNLETKLAQNYKWLISQIGFCNY